MYFSAPSDLSQLNGELRSLYKYIRKYIYLIISWPHFHQVFLWPSGCYVSYIFGPIQMYAWRHFSPGNGLWPKLTCWTSLSQWSLGQRDTMYRQSVSCPWSWILAFYGGINDKNVIPCALHENIQSHLCTTNCSRTMYLCVCVHYLHVALQSLEL